MNDINNVKEEWAEIELNMKMAQEKRNGDT